MFINEKETPSPTLIDRKIEFKAIATALSALLKLRRGEALNRAESDAVLEARRSSPSRGIKRA